MTKKLKYILLSVGLFSSFSNSFGCTCIYVPQVSTEAFLYDGLVFSGKIIDLEITYIKYQNDRWIASKIATFVVETWFSSQEVSDTVMVNTGVGGGDCGLYFKKGETWLMYADNFDGIIRSSICNSSINSNHESFDSSIKHLKELKLKSCDINEQLELDWSDTPYTLSGKLENGKPVGQWLRIKGTDTIACFNFNGNGKFQGYQMEKDRVFFDIKLDPKEKVYETTDTYVKIFNSKKELVVFYELKDGRRNGKYEEYYDNTIELKANYRNGRLTGEWISWHKDSAFSKGRIKTIKVFDNDKLISSMQVDESTGKEIK